MHSQPKPRHVHPEPAHPEYPPTPDRYATNPPLAERASKQMPALTCQATRIGIPPYGVVGSEQTHQVRPEAQVLRRKATGDTVSVSARFRA